MAGKTFPEGRTQCKLCILIYKPAPHPTTLNTSGGPHPLLALLQGQETMSFHLYQDHTGPSMNMSIYQRVKTSQETVSLDKIQ